MKQTRRLCANLVWVRAEIARRVIAGEPIAEIVHSTGVEGETQ